MLKQRWANMSPEDKDNFYKKVANTNIAKYGTKCTLNTEENIQKKKKPPTGGTITGWPWSWPCWSSCSARRSACAAR